MNFKIIFSRFIVTCFTLKYFAYLLIISAIVLSFWYLYFGNFFSTTYFFPDTEKAKEIQPFMAGIVLPLLTIGSTLLIFENLRLTSRQNFSSNFFKLIDLHHNLLKELSSEVDGLEVPYSNYTTSIKRDFFDDLAWRISTDYFEIILTDEEQKIEKKRYLLPNNKIVFDNKTGIDKLIIIYDYYYQIHQSDLGHYFRNLYHIVKFVENSPFSDQVKREHAHILRAQLSNYELLLLAYNCIHQNGKEKFKPLIEKYEFLKSLNTEENLTTSRIKRIVDLEILREAYPHFKKYHPKTVVLD